MPSDNQNSGLPLNNPDEFVGFIVQDMTRYLIKWNEIFMMKGTGRGEILEDFSVKFDFDVSLDGYPEVYVQDLAEADDFQNAYRRNVWPMLSAFDILSIDLFERAFYEGDKRLQAEFYSLCLLVSMMFAPDYINTINSSVLVRKEDESGSRYGIGGFGSQLRKKMDDGLNITSSGETVLDMMRILTYHWESCNSVGSANSRLVRYIPEGNIHNDYDLRIEMNLLAGGGFGGLSVENSFFETALHGEQPRGLNTPRVVNLLKGSYVYPIFSLLFPGMSVLYSNGSLHAQILQTYFSKNLERTNPIILCARIFSRLIANLDSQGYDFQRQTTAFSGVSVEKLLSTSISLVSSIMQHCFGKTRTMSTRSGPLKVVAYSGNASKWLPGKYFLGLNFAESAERFAVDAANIGNRAYPESSRLQFGNRWHTAYQRMTTDIRRGIGSFLTKVNETQTQQRDDLENIAASFTSILPRFNDLIDRIIDGSDYPTISNLLSLALAEDKHSQNLLANIHPGFNALLFESLNSRVSHNISREDPIVSRLGIGDDDSDPEYSTVPFAARGLSGGGTFSKILMCGGLGCLPAATQHKDRRFVMSVGLASRFLETLSENPFTVGNVDKKNGDNVTTRVNARKFQQGSIVYAPLVIAKRDERLPVSHFVMTNPATLHSSTKKSSPFMLPVNLRIKRLVPISDFTGISAFDQRAILERISGSIGISGSIRSMTSYMREAFSSIIFSVFDPITGKELREIELDELLAQIDSSFGTRFMQVPFNVPTRGILAADACRDGIELMLISEAINSFLELRDSLGMSDRELLAISSNSNRIVLPSGSSAKIASYLRVAGVLDYLGATETDVTSQFEKIDSKIGVSLESPVSVDSVSRSSSYQIRALSLAIKGVLSFSTYLRDRIAATTPRVYDRTFHLILDPILALQNSTPGDGNISNLGIQLRLGGDIQEAAARVYYDSNAGSSEETSLIGFSLPNDVTDANEYTLDEYFGYLDLAQILFQ